MAAEKGTCLNEAASGLIWRKEEAGFQQVCKEGQKEQEHAPA